MAKEFAKAFYNSKAWKETRQAVITRDRGRCQLCGKAGNEVDHIKELTEENINNAETALNLKNLRLLCHKCHTHKTREEKSIKKNSYVLDKVVFDENGFPQIAGSPPKN